MQVNLVQGSVCAILGIVLAFWARPLSVRYNAWTTRLRERNPNFNSPPTPEWRARNTRIMTVMFRVTGLFFIVLSIMYLLPLVSTQPH
jgi:hypothetical protein